MKLIMVDLDGTLFDTREVNYMAYQEAVGQFGYKIDYKYTANTVMEGTIWISFPR